MQRERERVDREKGLRNECEREYRETEEKRKRESVPSFLPSFESEKLRYNSNH